MTTPASTHIRARPAGFAKGPAVRWGDPEARFWAQVEKSDGCWAWRGRTHKGYGVFNLGRKHLRAHRFAYELLTGPIPDGLELDHLCRNPPCINPDHLEPVTRQENQRRRALHVTHCPKGHPYDEENTIQGPWGRSGRKCRTCDRAAKSKGLGRGYRSDLRR